MQRHTLKRHTKRSTKTRVGRGGTRGKTSGRGHKGQKSRAGGTPRPQTRDILKKIPKRRGYGKNRSRTVYALKERPVVINVSRLDGVFSKDDIVSPVTLIEKGVISRKGGKIPSVKILGMGDLKTSITIKDVSISDSARQKIEDAGGKIS